MKSILGIFTVILISQFMIACTGTQVFSSSARSGDTVAFTLGWNQELTTSDISMVITDSSPSTVPMQARAVVNLYPDPVSNLLVEMETDPESSPDTSSGAYWGFQVENSVTAADKDYSQKLIIADIPQGLSSGMAKIDITTPTDSKSVDVEILEPLPSPGASYNFGIQETLFQSLSISFGDKLRLAERAPHYVINFSGAQIPYAIEINLTHDADRDNGGAGRPFVTSSRNDIKSISWSDTGTDMKVIIMPTAPNNPLQALENFKFYVAGGLTGLAVDSVNAYDSNGAPVPGISAQISQN